MMVLLFMLAIVTVLPGVASGENPDIAWASIYNGPMYSGTAAAIALDEEGNVYVTGKSTGDGTSTDFATIKYNSVGVEQWVARYSSSGFRHDEAVAICLDSSGNVYVTGFSSGAGKDYTTIKYNSSGIEQWVSHYSGQGNETDEPSAICVDVCGNVYVTGSSNQSGSNADYATVKYNPDGIEQWVAYYNHSGNRNDHAEGIALDSDGYIYVTGRSINFNTQGTYDFATIKYTPAGVEEWVSRYDSPGMYSDDYSRAIDLDATGNVYVIGNTPFYDQGINYTLVKYDASGVEQWVSSYNGPYSHDDYPSALALDDSGNVYVTGRSSGNGTASDYATVKYNSSGVEQWVARYNGSANGSDCATDLSLDIYGNVYVTGTSIGNGTHIDYCTIKYNTFGEEEWRIRYNPETPGTWDFATAIDVDAAGNVYVTGGSEGGVSIYRGYATIKYSTSQDVAEEESLEIPTLDCRVFPNPAKSVAYATLIQTESSDCSVQVFSLDGRLVETLYDGNLPEGEHIFRWQASQFSPGVYLLKVNTNSLDSSYRIIVMR
ncbi:MAG: SBBP repeat-containing protein [Candidatus Fermentibacteraceae bacterium]|nr:SBBP repeat-containing protein [Candidatus Fermentibacteraceae bacterium]